MSKIKTIFHLLKYNRQALINFEFFYKVISVIIFTPLFLNLFKLITKITGYTYLTFENIGSFLLNPWTIFMLLMLIILLTFYSLIDISTIIIILNQSYNQEKITAKEAFLTAMKKLKKIFKVQNMGLPFLIVFLIPFLNFGISSSFISTIKIPEFIKDYIMHNTFLLGLYIIVVIFLCLLLFRWLYALHYFILEDKNFKMARKQSIKLSKKRKLKDFLVIMLTQIGVTISYLLFILVGIFLILGVYKLCGNKNILGNITITLLWLFIALSFITITLLATPISYAAISFLFYQHKLGQKETIKPLRINHQQIKKQTKSFKTFGILVTVVTIICGTIFTYYALSGKYDFKIEYVRTMAVTAHRGASVLYPENTMAAFVGAKELGADWVELDVQQTIDQKLIILHDTNLKRTTGLNKNTWDVTYDEVKKLDAGSFFSKDFAGEKIPLLEDVIKYAKANNLKLNIELKPTGHEKNFEAAVGDLITKYDFADMCVITSQVYEVLENIKDYNKAIKTVYVMSFAYGDITKLTAADNFSIEASSVTKPLVAKVHNAGKELYVWTVNTKENMNKMINLKVDNIITDNITLAKNTIMKSKTSNIVTLYIELIEKLFR